MGSLQVLLCLQAGPVQDVDLPGPTEDLLQAGLGARVHRERNLLHEDGV